MTQDVVQKLTSKYPLICCHVDQASRVFPAFFSFQMALWNGTGSRKQLARV